MQHGAQLGCQRFTAQQTGQRQRCRNATETNIFTFYTFLFMFMILVHSCRPSHCVHHQLHTSDHNRADWVPGVGPGCGKDGCAVEPRLEGDEERKWSNEKSRQHTEVKAKPQNSSFFSERMQPPPLSLPTASSTRGAELPFGPLGRR